MSYMRREGMQAQNQSLVVRMAIAHSHFEAVHPFRDGNGRVGRLLIPLMMDDAWVGSDRGRHLTFLFFEQSIFNKTFKLVVKTTWGGNEVIVSTFHKIEAEHVARLKRRCATVREAKV
jgi:hypothetical protein